MRRAIQMLQSLHRLHGERIEPQAVRDISGSVPDDKLVSVFETCKSQNFEAVQTLVSDVLADGYPAAQLAAQMLDVLVGDGPIGRAISSSAKAKIAVRPRPAPPCRMRAPTAAVPPCLQVELAQVDKQLIDGADEYMQLCNFLATTMRQLRA